MFVKIVIVLLLLIVVVSLLTGRATSRTAPPARRTRLRTLMLRVAAILLSLGALIAAFHFSR
jgi:hypothetical protein